MIQGGYNSALLHRVPFHTVQMDFEGADGGTNFDDYGLGKSTWTRSGANVTISTTQALEGSSSLKIANGADYLETSYTSDNRLPSYGDWDFSIAVYFSSGVTSKYILSIQGTAATGSDTALIIVTNASNQFAWGFSDGTTRTVRSYAGISISTGTWYRLGIERRGGTLIFRINGSNVDSFSFPSNNTALNFPSSRKIRIGKAEFAGTSGPDTAYFDKLRLTIDASGTSGV